MQSLTNYPSQALLEAIACGNYVVATDTIDTDYIVKDDFGCLVNNDERDISEGILKAMKIVSDKQEAVVCSARQFAEMKFNIRNSIEYFKNILEK